MKLSKCICLTIIVTVVLSGLSGCSLNTEVSNDKVTNEKDAETQPDTLAQVKEYLKDNYMVVNLENENEFSDLSIIENDLKDREIFLTGEQHGIKANATLSMKFLRYFKEKVDFKYYLCELPYSDGYFLNKFLESGDIKILENMYKPLKGTFYWTKESYEHWKKVYEFNKTLPEDRKIQVIGIDIEHQPENALRYMISVLPKKEVPAEIASKIKELNDIYNSVAEGISNYKLIVFSEDLRGDMQEKESIYKQYLGENLFGFKLVNDNILYRNEAYSANGNDFNKVRDKRIYENLMHVYETLPKAKYYGQWGLNHIFQKEQSGVKWMAAAMNEKDSVLENKVLSIAYIYRDCEVMTRNPDNTYSKSSTSGYDINGFSLYSKKNCTIFKLNNESSPFSRNLIWQIYDKPSSGVTTDYYQYIVLIEDSKATEPLNDKYD